MYCSRRNISELMRELIAQIIILIKFSSVMKLFSWIVLLNGKFNFKVVLRYNFANIFVP